MSAVIERNVEQERSKWMAILRDKNAPDGEILRAKVGIIETAREQIEDATASGVDGKVIVDYAIQLLREDPKILPCTVSSLVTSISRGAMCGLRLGGLRPEAYIVPVPVRKKVDRQGNVITGSAKTIEETPGEWAIIRTDANLWPSYHGWIKLVANTGRLLREPLVMVVYEGEEFSADFEDGVLMCKHKGSALNKHRKAGDDSKIAYAWARWQLDTGSVDVLLSREEIEAHKKQYSKKPKFGEWNWETKWREMAEKTVLIHSVRRRFVPMQVEAAGLGLVDDELIDSAPRLGIADSLGVVDGECQVVDEDQQESVADSSPTEKPLEVPQAKAAPEKQSPPPGEQSKPVADTAGRKKDRAELLADYTLRMGHAGDTKEAGLVFDEYLPPDDSNPHGFASDEQKKMVAIFQDRLVEVRPK